MADNAVDTETLAAGQVPDRGTFDSSLPSFHGAVTPSDANMFSHVVRAIRIGVAGDVNVKFNDDTTVIYTGVLAGEYIYGAIKQVMSTSTTATNIVAIW